MRRVRDPGGIDDEALLVISGSSCARPPKNALTFYMSDCYM